jgi:hypothetical protein
VYECVDTFTHYNHNIFHKLLFFSLFCDAGWDAFLLETVKVDL